MNVLAAIEGRDLRFRRTDFMGDFTTGDTNGSTRAETTARRSEDRATVEISFVVVGSREAFLFLFIWRSACTPFRRLFSFSLSAEYYGARWISLTCATNLSPREAELIRIRIPDTYFNMFALTLIYSKCSWKREERKREDKGGGGRNGEIPS